MSDRLYTYDDYLGWPEGQRWEIIDGIAYGQASPSPKHQRIVGRLFRKLGDYLDGKQCEPFIAPVGVVFEEGNQNETTKVVEPDIVVVCDTGKIKEKAIYGAPDFIIEVLSPTTAPRDLNLKRNLYEKYSVKEYWVVDPVNQYITAYILDSFGHYSLPVNYFARSPISPTLFPDFQINLSQIFAEDEG